MGQGGRSNQHLTMRHSGFLFFFGILLALACHSARVKPTPANFPALAADVETPAVQAAPGQDAADDPAIWVNPLDPANSVIVGTVKRYGLEVYALDGRLLHRYKLGNPNNVDIRNGFRLQNGKTIDLVAFSDRATNELAIMAIDPTDYSLAAVPGGRIKTTLGEVYGICLYKNAEGNFYAFINGKDGTVAQYRLFPLGQDGIGGEKVRSLKLQTQPEGMVADDRMRRVYFGEEDRGIWRVNAEPNSLGAPIFMQHSGADNPNIAYDVEGLAIYADGDTTGYLIASSQGNNSYAVFERHGANRYLGSFRIGDFGIDGASDTDGIEATPTALGGRFPQGLFVAQDGANLDAAGKLTSQNFKLVAWQKIAEILRK